MKFYGLYKITNLVNGKMYIGKHVTEDVDDGYTGSGKILKYAIRKYGDGFFRKEWLGFYEDEEELNYMERVFVDQTWVDRADTYNLKLGGDGGSNYSDESKKRMSLSHLGQTPWNKGKTMSDEFCKKNSDSHLGQTPWNKDLSGIYSEETLAKISASRKGKCSGDDNPRAMLGKHHTDEAKLRIGKASRERPSGMKGKHHSNATKAKMREKSLGNRANSGMKWWNNGVCNAMSFKCPPGFVAGRLKKKS